MAKAVSDDIRDVIEGDLPAKLADVLRQIDTAKVKIAEQEKKRDNQRRR